MKISKKCSEGKTKRELLYNDIPSGAVFRFGDHSAGPYLKLNNGASINLKTNAFHDETEIRAMIKAKADVKILPKAELVTHEED